MAKVTIETAPFQNPAWPQALLKPGTDATLKVDAPKIKGDQHVEFRICKGADLVDVVVGADGQQTATWKVPNLSSRPSVTFDALLKQQPTPQNGFHAVLNKVTSSPAQVTGFSVTIGNMDACFVPHTEQLHVAYTVADANSVATVGRIEIWGERYPTNKPLYTENFVPAQGAHNWNTWNGSANAGLLSGKFISPEFSPYRLRMIIGTDQGSIDDAFGAGIGKVAVAEKEFEVRFKTIEIRLQVNPSNSVKNALGMNAGQTPMLVVEPRTDKGMYAVTNRMPKKREDAVNAGWGGGEGLATGERDGMGRIRITGKRHIQIGEALNQGRSNSGNPANQGGKVWLHRLADSYMDSNRDENTYNATGPGQTKYAIEKNLYQRPELPVEVVGNLKSRDLADANKQRDGLFDKEAVGPALFDLYAEDAYADWMYGGGGGPVALYAEAQAYFKRAAMQVKWGNDTTPHHDGSNQPIISHWQQRFLISIDSQEEVGDTDLEFQKGKTELTVYLNRTKLTLDTDATADNSKEIKKDYAELSTKKIKLRKGLAFQNDVVWIIRTPDGALGYDAVDSWGAYPPGDNCHKRYGGARGTAPTAALVNALAQDFSGGLAGSFPYTGLNTITLDPDKVAVAKRERVESQAVIQDGNQKGLAGVIFSPSTMAGDKYVIEARLRERPYLRDLGWVADRPISWDVRGRSGTMVVWRLLTVTQSWRMSLRPNQRGLSAGVGENDPNAAGRAHPGDGRMMNFLQLNAQGAKAFSEWVILKANGTMALANEEPHQDLDLDAYRNHFNSKAAAGQAGFYNLPNTASINNYCVRWDHYRDTLPPGVPPNRRKVATWALNNNVPTGSSSTAAMNGVTAAINQYNTAHGAGAADTAGGGAGVPISPDTPNEYKGWVLRQVMKFANQYMDLLIPQVAAPAVMRVLRWPDVYFGNLWCGYPNAQLQLGIAGYCRGSGQAFFFSQIGNPDTFEHELGHSLFLIHFASGGITNFGWKHHDHAYPNCLMGYNSGSFTVPLPTGAVGPGITITTNPRLWMCPKCLLKVRGWDEILLPCNWTHPDVF